MQVNEKDYVVVTTTDGTKFSGYALHDFNTDITCPGGYDDFAGFDVRAVLKGEVTECFTYIKIKYLADVSVL